METINLSIGWILMLLGVIAGAAMGLFFYKEGFLGGYSAWPRRMVRLGHIAFFGIGLINVGYALSVQALDVADPSPWVSWLLVVCGVSMPLVCYLSAYRMAFRHLFPIPVISLLVALGLFVFGDLNL